jgi:hypothetical protein
MFRSIGRAGQFVTSLMEASVMNSIIYIVGLVVVILFVAGFLGLR